MRLPRPLRPVLVLCLALSALTPAFAADTYQVLHTYPHDQQAYTQGLIYLDGHLYESTGLKGHSSLRMEDLETGRILQFQDVPDKYFAEGLAAWKSGSNDTLIQLTWQDHIALVYDGKSLILSDGTATLRFLDPATFRVLRSIQVRDRGQPVTYLNELEYIHGQIYANVWYSDRIARISPATGKVLGWIDLAGLLPQSERSSPGAVLNGIAYDSAHDRLFVTGKLWPKLFEIRIIPEAASGKQQTQGAMPATQAAATRTDSRQ